VRLQGRESLVADLLGIKGTVSLANAKDIDDVMVKIEAKDDEGNKIKEIFVKPSEIQNINFSLENYLIGKGSTLHFFFTPLSNFNLNNFQYQQKIYKKTISDSIKKAGGGSSSQNKHEYYKTQKVSNNTTFLTYYPTKLTIKVKKGDTEITLPKVVLQKSAFVDNFTFNIKDGSNTPLNGVNIDIKYGIDNESELVAYSGTTDNNGQFNISQLAYGQYTATLSLAGYAPKVVNFTVSDTKTSIDEKMATAQGSTLDGSWVADSNHVPNVPQASYKHSIHIEKDGSDYKGTYKSIYSWYPNEYCGLLTSTSEADFVATINGNYLDLTFTTNSGNVRTECDDGSWVNADEFTKGETLRLELNSNNSGILSLKDNTCGWNQAGVCEQRMPLFYKFGDN